MSTVSGVHFCLSLDAQVGPASRISRARAATIVASAMNLEAPSLVNIKRPPRRRPWRRVALLMAAAIVLPVTMVAAGTRIVAARRAASASALVVAAAPPVGPTEPKSAAFQGEAPAVPAPAIVPSAEAPVAAIVPPPTEPRHARREAAAAQPSVPGQTPQDMLQKANDLRAQHQWFAATQVYEQTIRTFPNRAEAYSATVAAAVLRLDQLGDARAALDLFSSAIRARPRGALSEEARWGIVQSYRSLGDRASERARLQEFVTLYPQSLQAARAHARLHELGAETPSTL